MTKKQIILLHVLFWIVILISPLCIQFSSGFEGVSQGPPDTPEKLDMRATYDLTRFLISLLAPVSFYIAYVISFRIIKHKKTLLFVFTAVILMAIPVYFINRWYFFVYVTLFGTVIPWTALGLLFRLFIDWINKEEQALILSEQNLKSELALLRNQINPHFLFNSLHNIDAMIFCNPERASESLINLSGLLRQILYESDRIPLSQEIDIVRKYVDLQSLRTSNKDYVSLTLNNVTADPVVAPMLFIPFIENAFKHTTNKHAKEAIRIEFVTDRRDICFNVSNLYDNTKNPIKDSSHGIGLDNVKRRLQLVYPDRHSLNIFSDETHFHVQLRIEAV